MTPRSSTDLLEPSSLRELGDVTFDLREPGPLRRPGDVISLGDVPWTFFDVSTGNEPAVQSLGDEPVV